MEKTSSENDKKKHWLNDDMIDAAAALGIIAIIVAGISFWLEAMP